MKSVWEHPVSQRFFGVDFLNNAYMQWETNLDDWYKRLKWGVSDVLELHI